MSRDDWALQWLGIAGAALLLLGSADTAHSQEARDSLEPGGRIRVWAAQAGLNGTSGRFLERRGDSLRVRLGSVPRLVSLSDISRLEIRRYRSHWKAGAMIGAGTGAVLTTAFLVPFCSDPDTVCDGDEELRAIALIGLPPVVLGAFLGHLLGDEEWVDVRLDGSRAGASSVDALAIDLEIELEVPGF